LTKELENNNCIYPVPLVLVPYSSTFYSTLVAIIPYQPNRTVFMVFSPTHYSWV